MDNLLQNKNQSTKQCITLSLSFFRHQYVRISSGNHSKGKPFSWRQESFRVNGFGMSLVGNIGTLGSSRDLWVQTHDNLSIIAGELMMWQYWQVLACYGFKDVATILPLLMWTTWRCSDLIKPRLKMINPITDQVYLKYLPFARLSDRGFSDSWNFVIITIVHIAKRGRILKIQ